MSLEQTFRRTVITSAILSLALLTVSPAGARAQTPTSGSLIVERIENGFAVTPDFKFSELDDRAARLAGVYGGWVTDGRILVGGGGYWLTNRDDDFSLGYGGVVLEWFTKLDGPVDFSLRGLVGGGRATLSDDIGLVEIRVPGRRFRPPSTRTVDVGRVVRREQFFVAEPQANVLFRVTDWLRVGVGAGYRLIGSADDLGERLAGFTGTVGLQFGL